MATRSVRFGIGDPTGLRSAEWLVLWKTKTSDVYLASRALGNTLRVSLHETGRCHVHGPDPRHWRGTEVVPRFVKEWKIDREADLQQPIGVIIPVSELRAGTWAPQRDKGTVWIKPQRRSAVAVRVFLSRTPAPRVSDLAHLGWHKEVVRAQLPNGKHLTVLAGDADLPEKECTDLLQIKAAAKVALARMSEPWDAPRLLLLTKADDNGTPHLVDAAVSDPI